MPKKYFHNNDSEFCYQKEYFREFVDPKTGILEVFEAKILTGTGFFFCQELELVGESGDGCGRECIYYEPRNGKNGRCRLSGPVYEQGKKITLKFKTPAGGS